jgi:large subunit ribosomal protein L18
MAKVQGRDRRKQRIRKKIAGTAERPRLTVFRSAKHMYAQVVDDSKGITVAAASTLVEEADAGNKTEAARKVGDAIAQACLSQGISKVVFDRNGYLYHGRVQAVADAARKAGLNF